MQDLVLALLLTLSAHRMPRGAEPERFAAAIASTDATVPEARALAAIAWAETRLKPRGSDSTPPFGLTHWVQMHPRESLTVERAARLALRILRFKRSVRRCGPRASWAVVLGAFHAGQCVAGPLARRQAAVVDGGEARR